MGTTSMVCDAAWRTYVLDLAWPFALPIAVAAATLVLHCTCCFVACCRCCRRQICCRERPEAYNASTPHSPHLTLETYVKLVCRKSWPEDRCRKDRPNAP